jgi:hypothetical protein
MRYQTVGRFNVFSNRLGNRYGTSLSAVSRPFPFWNFCVNLAFVF